MPMEKLYYGQPAEKWLEVIKKITTKPTVKFKIKPKSGRFYFNVLVFDTKPEMWAYNTKENLRAGIEDNERFGAMCKSYKIIRVGKDGSEEMKSDIGTILFAKSQLGAGTVAHEIGHAAFHYDRLINGNEKAEYGDEIGESEERVLYLLAEMVSDCVNKMYKLNIL